MTSIVREHNVSVNTVHRILASCYHRLAVLIIYLNILLSMNLMAQTANYTLFVEMAKK